MSDDAWQRAADEHFVRAYADQQRAIAEKAAREQVRRAAEWRRRAERGEVAPAFRPDGRYRRLYPDHDHASAYSGIFIETVGAIYQRYAATNPPPAPGAQADFLGFWRGDYGEYTPIVTDKE